MAEPSERVYGKADATGLVDFRADAKEVSTLADELIRKTVYEEGYWFIPEEKARVIDLILKEGVDGSC